MARDLLADPPAAAPAGGRDLLAQSPEEARIERLRKISLGALKFGGKQPGAGDLYSDSYTWGLMKPVNALAGAVSGELTGLFGAGAEPDATFGERWRAGTQAYDDYLAEARKNAGWAGTAADIAGSLTSGRPGASTVSTGRSFLPVVGQAAFQGGVEGAARNSEDVTSAITGGLENAAVGAVTAGAVHQASKLLPGNRAARAAEREAARGPSGDDIKNNARALYKQLDQAGVAYDLNQSTRLADDLRTDLVHNGWDPGGIHAGLDKVLGDIDQLRGQPVSLETLMFLRERVGSAAREGDPQIRRIASRALSVLDGFVGKENPALSQMPGNQVGPMWQEARRLWKTAGMVDDVNWRLDKAERRAASANSGQNTENAIRQNVRALQDRATQPGKYSPYNDAEIAQMDRVVRGTPAQNTLRWAGNQIAGIPAQTALGALGGYTGITHGFSPLESGAIALGLTGATQGAGHLLKNRAANMAQDEADTLVRLISTGSTAPLANAAVNGPPTRANLARLLLEQQAARGGANLVSGRL